METNKLEENSSGYRAQTSGSMISARKEEHSAAHQVVGAKEI